MYTDPQKTKVSIKINVNEARLMTKSQDDWLGESSLWQNFSKAFYDWKARVCQATCLGINLVLKFSKLFYDC